MCIARSEKFYIQITRLSNTEHFCPHHIHRNMNQMKWVKNNPSLFYQRTKSCTQNALSFAGSQWPLCSSPCPGLLILSCYVCTLPLHLWGKGEDRFPQAEIVVSRTGLALLAFLVQTSQHGSQDTCVLFVSTWLCIELTFIHSFHKPVFVTHHAQTLVAVGNTRLHTY